MAKSKLLKALDFHRGRDYKLEKQKKQQKQAAQKKKSRPPSSNLKEKENVPAHVDSNHALPEAEGWESDESEAAKTTAVCRASLVPYPTYR